MDWRDELALRSKRQADYAWTVLARVLSWAKDRGKITVNPCERGGRVYHGTRVDFVWSVEDEAEAERGTLRGRNHSNGADDGRNEGGRMNRYGYLTAQQLSLSQTYR
jgi:hypothetical protein